MRKRLAVGLLARSGWVRCLLAYPVRADGIYGSLRSTHGCHEWARHSSVNGGVPVHLVPRSSCRLVAAKFASTARQLKYAWSVLASLFYPAPRPRDRHPHLPSFCRRASTARQPAEIDSQARRPCEAASPSRRPHSSSVHSKIAAFEFHFQHCCHHRSRQPTPDDLPPGSRPTSTRTASGDSRESVAKKLLDNRLAVGVRVQQYRKGRRPWQGQRVGLGSKEEISR